MSQATNEITRNPHERSTPDFSGAKSPRKMQAATVGSKQPPAYPAFVAVRRSPGPGEFLRDFWVVSESGTWSRDVAAGRRHARAAIRFMREERAPHILNWIAADMVRKQHFGPIEVGFFHELGRALLEHAHRPGRKR